jgi:hypothetical protein
LIPEGKNNKQSLKALNGANRIIPLDSYLEIAGLPFKITPNAMLKISYWAQNQLSFKRAEEAVHEIMGVRVSYETIRMVTNFVGNAVFENDCRRADEAYALLNSGKLAFRKDLNGVLYIQTDLPVGRQAVPLLTRGLKMKPVQHGEKTNSAKYFHQKIFIIGQTKREEGNIV